MESGSRVPEKPPPSLVRATVLVGLVSTASAREPTLKKTSKLPRRPVLPGARRVSSAYETCDQPAGKAKRRVVSVVYGSAGTAPLRSTVIDTGPCWVRPGLVTKTRLPACLTAVMGPGRPVARTVG